MKLFLSTLALVLPLTAHARPEGAAGCGTGVSAASAGPHGNDSGDMSAGGYSVDLTTDGNDIIVELTGGTFRGFLFRMEDVEIDDFDDGIAQEASVCSAPAVGVTHTSRADKTAASATFTTDGPGTYDVEVTVVENFLTHFYEKFSITVDTPATPNPTEPAPEAPSPPTAPAPAPAPSPPTPPADDEDDEEEEQSGCRSDVLYIIGCK